VFADESGTHGNTPCYGIGAVSIPRARLRDFNRHFEKIATRHNVSSELNWEDVGNRFSDINAIIDWVVTVLSSKTIFFDVIVVNTHLFRNWNAPGVNREREFYKTYTLLLKHVVRRAGDIADVIIDDRKDAYPKHHEAMQNIANSMLARFSESGRLALVRKEDSKDCPGVQVADVLTGMMVSAHSNRITDRTSLNAGKRVVIEKVAAVFGWDHLCYDTMPNSQFNVWHFPPEWRNIPRTRALERHEVGYVTRQELVDARARHGAPT